MPAKPGEAAAVGGPHLKKIKSFLREKFINPRGLIVKSHRRGCAFPPSPCISAGLRHPGCSRQTKGVPEGREAPGTGEDHTAPGRGCALTRGEDTRGLPGGLNRFIFNTKCRCFLRGCRTRFWKDRPCIAGRCREAASAPGISTSPLRFLYIP